jgi:glyoxylase-like metal-dependent hydrolase (beta-lactamase superfamily II)
MTTTMFRRRLALAPLFLLALAWSFERSVAPAAATVTEEGQSVMLPRSVWQRRELAKLLPLDQPWPTNQEMAGVLRLYGLDKSPLPSPIPLPARIATGVYLVGQDHTPSNNLTYLIDCGAAGVAIIDPTFDSEVERTLANVEKCGFARRDVRWVLNTHCHFDHAMADKKFRDMGAQIIVHEADAAAIEKGTAVTWYSSLVRTMGAAVPPEFPRCAVDHRLSDGEDLRLGNKVLYVIHTPGHTPGSSSFLLRADGKNLLISGDTIFYDGMLGAQGNPYADNRRYLASVEKLRTFTLDGLAMRWDMLLPGHGAIAQDRAYLDVQKDAGMLAGDLAAGREPVVSPHPRREYRERMFGRPATQAGQ